MAVWEWEGEIINPAYDVDNEFRGKKKSAAQGQHKKEGKNARKLWYTSNKVT